MAPSLPHPAVRCWRKPPGGPSAALPATAWGLPWLGPGVPTRAHSCTQKAPGSSHPHPDPWAAGSEVLWGKQGHPPLCICFCLHPRSRQALGSDGPCRRFFVLPRLSRMCDCPSVHSLGCVKWQKWHQFPLPGKLYSLVLILFGFILLAEAPPGVSPEHHKCGSKAKRKTSCMNGVKFSITVHLLLSEAAGSFG